MVEACHITCRVFRKGLHNFKNHNFFVLFNESAPGVSSPRGAHFTSCEPDYGRDEAFQKQYAAATGDEWPAFLARYIDVDESAYQAAVHP